MINYLDYLNVPIGIGLAVIGCFAIMQIIGEVLEFKGKVVPEFLKIRKFFSRKRKEKREMSQTLQEVKKLLADVNTHYSDDNIAKRNNWMQWVNKQATLYESSIADINKSLSEMATTLRTNTKLAEEMFVQSSRDRIIDFAAKVSNENFPVSREEFNRIFKIYSKYEKFISDHGMTNGEIDIAYHIINESYEQRLKLHSFIEDVRGYTNE